LDDQDSWFGAKALGIGTMLSAFLSVAIRSLVGFEFALFYWVLSVPMIVEIIWHFLILPPLLLAAAVGRYVKRK